MKIMIDDCTQKGHSIITAPFAFFLLTAYKYNKFHDKSQYLFLKKFLYYNLFMRRRYNIDKDLRYVMCIKEQ